jgi:hypothetical protein
MSTDGHTTRGTASVRSVGTIEPGGERDRPLSFRWKPLNPKILDCLGLPTPPSALHAQTRASILTEAYIIGRGEPERWISYSRRRDFYTGQRRYRGTAYTYKTVVREIDLLAKFGLIENVVAERGRRGWQSAFRATLDLINGIDQPLPAVFDPHELIRLKDAQGKLIDYRDTAETAKMRRQLTNFNEAIATADIALTAPGAVRDGDIIRCGRHTLYLAQRAYHRVFNRSWQRGGRMYGPWWQSARAEDRAYIEINGELVVELDYPAHHLRMAYAIAHAIPPLAPYTIPGWDRQVVKWAVLIMFNAKSYRDAIGAVANLIGGEIARQRAVELIRAVKDLHAAVAHLFHTDLGVSLQRRDAEMATDIIQRLLRQGIVSLSVHDSFIAAARYGGELHEAMFAAWWQFLTSIDSSLKPIPYTKLIPHMEEWVGAGVCPVLGVDPEPLVVLGPLLGDLPVWLDGSLLPPLCLVLPAPAQLDLFGGASGFSVPARELEGWHRGFAPPSVRRAVDHEIRRRGMLRIDFARHLGVSKQHLTNVLHGRFGASPALASGLAAFIRDGARSNHRSRKS